MTIEKKAPKFRTAAAGALLLLLTVAAVVTGCQLGPFGGSQASDEAAVRDDTPPLRAGWVLMLRDGDLRLLSGHWERQVTHTGDYVTAVLTRDGDVIGLRRLDDGGSSLVRLQVDETSATTTAEFALDLELPDYRPIRGYLVLSPDGEHVLVGNRVIGLNSGRRTRLVPGGLADIWSPEGSQIAYLVPAGDWDPDSLTVRNFDLWVADVGSGAAPRRIATGLMDWFDMYGRDAESIAWSKDGAELFVLSADGAERIERRGRGYGLWVPVNNRLVSVQIETGEERVLASSEDLRQRLEAEVEAAADQVVVSAATTPDDGGPAAFLVMDYERAYGIGLMGADGELDRLVVEFVPERHTVRMGAPVWSPDGTRLAYFGWYMTHQKPFIDVLDVATGAIDRVWESTEYRKPGHWDISPDGNWVWIVVSIDHPDDPRLAQDLSMFASLERPGHVESVEGIVLDWCCADPGK